MVVVIRDAGPTDVNPWTKEVPLVGQTLSPLVCAILVETLLYGIHAVLFAFCAYVLFRHRTPIRIAMLVSVTIMFVLSTADIAFSFHVLLTKSRRIFEGVTISIIGDFYPKFVLHLVNNFIADALLIIRCYIVWSRNKYILAVSGIALLAGTVIGIIGEGTKSATLKNLVPVYVLIVLVLNVVVTLLTAGRIWRIGREVRRTIGKNWAKQYSTAMAVVIESGLIYSLAIITLAVLAPTNFVLIGAGITTRVACIMPTLIISQIALGHSAQDLQATLSTARGPESTVILDTILSSEAFYPGARTTTQHMEHGAEEERERDEQEERKPAEEIKMSARRTDSSA